MSLADLAQLGKLPRGEWLIVQVGDRFYAGDERASQTVTREVKEPVPRSKNPVEDKALREAHYGKMWWGTRRARDARSQRDHRKDGTAEYLKPRPYRTHVTATELSGARNPKLVELESQAKRFRSEKSAKVACERLKGMYGDLGAKVIIKRGGIK